MFIIKNKIYVKPLWLDKMTLSRGLRETNAEPGAWGRQRGLWVRRRGIER